MYLLQESKIAARFKWDVNHKHLTRLVVLKRPGFQSQKYGMPMHSGFQLARKSSSLKSSLVTWSTALDEWTVTWSPVVYHDVDGDL